MLRAIPGRGTFAGVERSVAMTRQPRTWMISNRASRRHDEEAIERVTAILAGGGRPVTRHVLLGEEDLPTGEEAKAAGVETVVIHGGDGTISAAAHALRTWRGEILVLPGGTMNLLSHALHGERDCEDIARCVIVDSPPAVPIPAIVGDGLCALAGIIAGPTSAWGKVREHIRQADIGALASSIPEAVSETLAEDSMRLDGWEQPYAAFYLQPAKRGVMVRGILARNAADLLKHGWAWLSGDFRQGPSDDLGVRPAVTLEGEGSVDLLVDGEPAEAGSTVSFRKALSRHRYVSCRGGISWS